MQMTESQLSDHNLSEEDLSVLEWIHNRKSVDYMASKLDTKSRNVRRRINGLCGKTDEIPKKYHKQNKFVKKLPRKFSGAIRFQLNWRGLEVISDDLPHKNDTEGNSESVSLPEGNKSGQGERVRPHWLLSKHQIRGSPDGWGEELKVDERRQVYTERQFKELPDGSEEEFITTYYDGYEVQLYRETVVVRVDFPESRFRPEVLWRKYRSRVREILSFVEDKFGLELISRPEHIEACMRGQHWAEVDNLFADWLWSNRDEVGDDREGLQFHVYDEDGDQMALVDASHGDPEFEWVHTQEAKAHMSNMKDLIMWGGYYEITPKDFKSLAWLRKNKDLFENVLDRLDDLEGVQERLDELKSDLDLTRSQVEGLTVSIRQVRSRLDDLEDSVGSLGSEVDDLGLSVKVHEDQLQGLMDQMQNNRDEFYEELNSQRDKVLETRSMAQDVVERVDYTRQEVGEVEDRLERTKENLSESFQQDFELLRGDLDDVSQRVTGVAQQNQELNNNQEDIMKELQMQREQNARKMDRLIEEQQKTFVDRVRDNVKSMKGVVSSVATALF
jgi:predicted  nucleic acid-binding Zn-ribbon protein